MRKILIIFFLFTYTLGATEIGQLLKLPLLFQHFQTHQYINPSISFIDFLEEHYNQPDVQDFDHEKDRQLPFKTIENATSFAYFMQPAGIEYNFYPIQIFESKTFLSNRQHFYAQLFIIGIFQPPQV